MSERRDSWLARLTGADHRHAELERLSEEAAALRAELATERALAEQQAAEIEQQTHEREELEDQLEQLAAQSLASEQALQHARRQLADAEQRAASAEASLQRQGNELAIERTKASSGIKQAQQAQARIDALQQAASAREFELSQLQTAHDKVLKKNDALEERLSRNEHELANSAQQNGELTSRLVAVSAAQQRGLREERQRWSLLAGNIWKALVRTLGPTASVPLARELDAERIVGTLGRIDTPEAASAPLSRALSELSLCEQVAVTRQGRELELQLQALSGEGRSAQGWVGVLAVQCLASMLGRNLQTYQLQEQAGELVVRARFRDREESASASA